MALQTISIMLVDDHPLFRAGVAASLRSVDGLSVVCEAADGETAIRLWTDHRPDVALVDLALPGISGVETIRRIRHMAADARLLALSSSSDPQSRSAALQAGACGYVIKTVRFHDLVEAVRVAARHDRVPSVTVATKPLPVDLAGLTAREFEVLQMLRMGMQYDEIANRLAITERTARKHATNVKEKLGAANVAEAVAKGFERGLLSVIPHSPT